MGIFSVKLKLWKIAIIWLVYKKKSQDLFLTFSVSFAILGLIIRVEVSLMFFGRKQLDEESKSHFLAPLCKDIEKHCQTGLYRTGFSLYNSK